ncbi:uncharacterized protein LOC143005711 [Genypterus blacodes]|uniref:uncharacterized protein LOC143005711 n=1 Tax=Genypterus blacodes TaxID=154954 RepID=UPI003F75813E
MDVSIAVSLIRGQMGAVVERAVNGAVETVLAEMLRVVGVKFEELKTQVLVMKKDMAALQREKALKDKENDSFRAKLRYTELKLKYYRQGVEEELQQRASTSTLVRIHPSSFPPAQRGGTGVPPTEASTPCSTHTRSADGALARSNQGLRVAERDTVHSGEEEDECEWTLQAHTEDVDSDLNLPVIRSGSAEPRLQSGSALQSLHGSQADSSTLPSVVQQVKQEAQEEEEEEEEVICIKEEPEEEQEVMATLMLDCQLQQRNLPQSEGREGQRSTTEWTGLQVSQRNIPDPTVTFSSTGPSSYPLTQLASSLPSVVTVTPGIPPCPGSRPWTKDLSLFEEYKMRRNELRRRNVNRRRELEKTLPQPLLADLVRERREKTRLRVARWRAKRKLQACLNQAQAQGGAAGLCQQLDFPISSQHQHPCASSRHQQRSSAPPNSNNTASTTSFSDSAPFTSTYSPSLLLGAAQANHHAVTSSSSYPQVSLSQQTVSLPDTDVF